MIRSAELLQAEQRTRDGQHESRRGRCFSLVGSWLELAVVSVSGNRLRWSAVLEKSVLLLLHISRLGDGLHQEGSASQDDRCGSGSYPAEVGSLADIDDVADEVEVALSACLLLFYF